jgi:hypothetical protein
VTDKKCCTYVCNQGRNCPVRQACELAEANPPSTARAVVNYVIDFLASVGVVAVLALLLGVVWGYVK